MSDSLKKLKEIPVVNKLMAELERALDVKDKVLAEFVLDLAKQCRSVAEFEKLLEEYEAEFSIELINTIYATVTRMLPEYFQNKSSQLQADPGSHFVKTKMIEDEHDRPVTGGKFNDKAMTEEDKFDQSEAFDRDFLTKKYPGLALPNVRNKEEIDIFGDLK